MTTACWKVTAALAIVFASAAFHSPVRAQAASGNDAADPFGFEVEIGAGGVVSPLYEGSDDYHVTPVPVVRLRRLNLGGINIDATDSLGWSVYPSFRYLDRRESSDIPGLSALPDRKASLELGLGAAYEAEFWRVFAEVRHGAIGHNGLVAELGSDLIFRPGEDITFRLGPRLSFADDTYMDWAFGTPAGFAPIPAYIPDGGLKSAGQKAFARYDLDRAWSLEAGARWDRLVSDAEASPITAAGAEDQFIFSLGFVRRFTFGLPD